MRRIRYLLTLVCGAICLPASPLAAQAPQPVAPSAGVLQLDGHAIKSLTLVRQGQPAGGMFAVPEGQRYDQPGEQLSLAPGKYRVQEVVLEGGFAAQDYFGGEEDWFEIAVDQPHRLAIGAPLTPKVTATRHGRFLEMEYQLLDAAGRNYQPWADLESDVPYNSPPAPQFQVYMNDELLGSEAFQYG